MTLTRRRFLVAAAASLVAPARPERWVWRGSALGGEATLVLDGLRDEARAAAEAAAAEIARLERLFSLHRPDSQLARLNRDGRLARPARDLRAALAAAESWKRRTEGAFDAAVQPLWEHYARGADGPPPLDRIAGARVSVNPAEARLTPGAAFTLNGVAQGMIADRVAALLAARGFTPRLIDAGEMRLPGPDRRPVAFPDAGLRLNLADCAVAVSTPGALRFAQGHHLFDPRTGASPARWRSVAVIAPDAETADALSTAFAVSEPDRIGDLLPDGAAVLATDAEGRTRRFGRLPRGSLT